MPKFSTAVERARKRRSDSAKSRSKRTEWFINEVSKSISLTIRQRVTIATEFVKNQVIVNISRPVTKTVVVNSLTGNSRTVVSDRSLPGEFPKADTTQLMKTVFSDYNNEGPTISNGYIGTPLDYGLILETLMDRPFLVRTLKEERDKVKKILAGPIK